jgi:hypothetical protein
MAAFTTNYQFDVPTSSDLVKNGATQIALLGQDLDTFLFRPFSKNGTLNGSMNVWQRGTSVSVATNTTAYTADRWLAQPAGLNMATTVSRQATGDATNLPNIQYALRYQRNSGQTGTSPNYFAQSFETINSVQYAGQTVTFSFYARKGANYSPTSSLLQVQLQAGTSTDSQFITGATNVVNTNATLTTTWQRFTYTGTTVPTNTTQMGILFTYNPTGTAGAADYFEITGVQVEVGSQASPYAPATPTYATELAACQRYYWRWNANSNFATCGIGAASSTTTGVITVLHPVPMRTLVSAIDSSASATLRLQDQVTGLTQVTASIEVSQQDLFKTDLNITVVGATQYRFYRYGANNSTSAYLGFSAEL